MACWNSKKLEKLRTPITEESVFKFILADVNNIIGTIWYFNLPNRRKKVQYFRLSSKSRRYYLLLKMYRPNGKRIALHQGFPAEEGNC